MARKRVDWKTLHIQWHTTKKLQPELTLKEWCKTNTDSPYESVIRSFSRLDTARAIEVLPKESTDIIKGIAREVIREADGKKIAALVIDNALPKVAERLVAIAQNEQTPPGPAVSACDSVLEKGGIVKPDKAPVVALQLNVALFSADMKSEMEEMTK
jgi:hypothetical protein